MKYVNERNIRWVMLVILVGVLVWLGYKGVHTHLLSKRFEDGDNLFRLEDYEGAITEYREVFEESTEQNVKTIALRAIGQTYYDKLKNYEQALSAFQELIETFPDSRFQEEAMFKVAYCLGQLGRDDEALEQYEALVTQFPESKSQYFTLAYFNQGATYSSQRNYDKARENYEKSSQSTTDRKRKAEIQLRIGGTYQNQGDYEKAIAVYKALLEEYPDSNFIAQAKKAIADSHFNMEKWDQAIDWYNKVIKEHQDAIDLLPNCYYKIGNAYNKFSVKHTEASETDQAIEKLKQGLNWYQKTINNFPDSYLTRYNISYDLYQIWNTNYEKQNNKAAQLALQMLKGESLFSLDLRMVETDLILIAYKSERQQNYQEALRAYQELVNNFPSSDLISSAWYGLGNANYQLKNYKEARKILAGFLQLFPNSDLKGEVRRLSAQSYLDEEKYNQAFINFDTLTSTEFEGSPQLQADAMYRAAYSLKKLSVDEIPNYEILNETLSDEVLARYTEFLTLFPDSKYVSDAYFDQGKIYAAQKKYEFALKRCEDALRNTDNPKRRAEIQVAIGRVYFNQRIKATTETAKTVFDKKAIEAFEGAIKAAEQAIEADIDNAKLDRIRAQSFIVNIHIQRKDWGKVRDDYKSLLEEYGEAEYVLTDTVYSKEPIETSVIPFFSYRIAEAYYKMNDFGNALEWYEKIAKERGFQTDDSVPKTLKEKDFRIDALAPQALYRALLVRNQLGGPEKLEDIANKYINDIRDHNPLLSAKARFNFGKIKREELKDNKGAAQEFAKLAAYRGSDLRLNLIKLKGKYYEGGCYNDSEDVEKAYKQTVMLFNLNFQRLIDNPHIKSPNISKEVFDYCIQTALEYAEKACDKIKNTEYGKKACDEIKEARRKLEDKDKTMQKSDASNNSNSSETSQTNGQLTPEQIAQKASGSTVFITMEGIMKYESGQVIGVGGIDEKDGDNLGTGSGFFIKPNLIATNYHVISPKRLTYNEAKIVSYPLRGTARLVGTDREYAIIGYTAIDPDRDLAILKVRAFGVPTLPRGDSEEVNQGEAVYPIGNPLGLANVVSEGQISSVQWVKSIGEFMNNKSKLVRDFRRDDTPHKLFIMTAPISGGNSGGPVLDSKGRVIGVSVGSRVGGQNLNYAVPVNYLKALLNLVGPPKPLSDLEIIY